ncbi:MAG: PAS domain-containing protein, partial [Rhizobacter sp.]
MNPLHESEARIRAFADAVPAMLWETDPTGRCTFLSREWYSFTGQTEAEALGLGWTSATHPDDQAEAARIFLRANTSREEFRLEYRLHGARGEYRWALDVGRPRFTATGEYLGMVGAVIDIDERKQAEEAFTASEVRRQLALEAAEVGMWHVDLATGAIQSDARFRTIFGAAVADYPELFAIIHPDDVPAVQEAIAAATRPDDPAPYAIEYRIVQPDG